ncbi:MAG: IclR family transcriptional regulator [Burkholderiales bacterium]
MQRRPLPQTHPQIEAAGNGGAPAVSRAVAILRLLGKSESPMSLTAIAEQLGLVPSSCLRLLRVLVAEELVAMDPARKHYRLDAGILPLARSVLRPHNFARLVQPALDRLSSLWPVTAVAVQAVSLDHMVVVAVSESSAPLRVHVEMGSRFPALMSATGRCVAAFSREPWSVIEAKFRAVQWANPPTFRQWRTEVEAARANRYSVDEGHYIAGVTVVSAAVLDAGEAMTHAVIVLGVSEQIARPGVAAIARELRGIAAGFSAAPAVRQRMASGTHA